MVHCQKYCFNPHFLYNILLLSKMTFCSSQVSNDCGQQQERKRPNVLSKNMKWGFGNNVKWVQQIHKITLQIKFSHKGSCVCNGWEKKLKGFICSFFSFFLIRETKCQKYKWTMERKIFNSFVGTNAEKIRLRDILKK